jgi:hydrogenase maturation factor
MNLHYGEIVEMMEEDGILVGRIRVGRSTKKVPINLLIGPRCGDKVLVCDGVAINKVEEDENVPSDSRQAH